MKKNSKLLSIVLVLALLFSCKKDSETTPAANGKTAKFTITANGVNSSDDYVSFVIVGGDTKGTKTIWKVNGVTRNNEAAISLGKDDFTGSTKTYVIETVLPVDVITAGVQCINFNASYQISYKAEINGKVITNDDGVTVDVNKDYTHQFDY
ncbi:hypothetical protein FFJ24_019310 [Pedobacter sp. KBS0701]|uniref:hypothetical protein n=1 Tax=Pedobacter sp. KBS0701 TaxID=2578106 RepID=UPI00110E1CF9|nr:hypothetical protein [Pedobacter sp. KBS0701]QDW26855.1 hypothetical protein FFJ24_019310 [Pedobacter sp. KBS0701]